MVGHRLLAEEEAAGRQAMAQGDGFHADGAVIVNHGTFARVEGVEHHLIGHTLAEKLQLRFQQTLQVGMGMDVEVGRAFQHAERGNQSHEPEAMVAVEVRDEDVVQPAELQLGAAELHLCAFAAVNHEQFLADVEHLRGGLMAGSGQGRTASQDV